MVFTQRYKCTVDRDNTVSFYNVIMQLERAEWRPTLAGCKVIIHQHLDQILSRLVRHQSDQWPCGRRNADGKLCRGVNRSRLNTIDWAECEGCAGSGRVSGLRCERCEGVGWIDVRR